MSRKYTDPVHRHFYMCMTVCKHLKSIKKGHLSWSRCCHADGHGRGSRFNLKSGKRQLFSAVGQARLAASTFAKPLS